MSGISKISLSHFAHLFFFFCNSTSNPSNFVAGMVASKSSHMRPQAVADQVQLVKRQVGGFL